MQYHLALEKDLSDEFKKDDLRYFTSDVSGETSEGYVSQSYTSSDTSNDSMEIEITDLTNQTNIQQDHVTESTRETSKVPLSMTQIQAPDFSSPISSSCEDSFPVLNSTEYISTTTEGRDIAGHNYHKELDISDAQYDFDGSSAGTDYVSNGVWSENVTKSCSTYSMNDELSVNLDDLEKCVRLDTTSDYIQS